MCPYMEQSALYKQFGVLCTKGITEHMNVAFINCLFAPLITFYFNKVVLAAAHGLMFTSTVPDMSVQLYYSV